MQWFSPITRGPSDWPPALQPAWIHDLLVLWRRRQPFGLLMEQAMVYTAQEILHPAPRQTTLRWLANMFVPTRGRGVLRRTLTQNVWAAYSHTYKVEELAPAYLAHIIQQQPLAQRLSATLADACLADEVMDPARFRRLAADHEIALTLGTAIAWLDTLRTWGILAPRRRQYTLRGPLAVSPEIFPLLVWIWWHEHRQTEVPLAQFAASPFFAWIDARDFTTGWESLAGRVWELTEVDGQAVARLQPHDVASFRRTLLNLLSTKGRDNRQQPRRGRPEATRAEAPPVTDSADYR